VFFAGEVARAAGAGVSQLNCLSTHLEYAQVSVLALMVTLDSVQCCAGFNSVVEHCMQFLSRLQAAEFATVLAQQCAVDCQRCDVDPSNVLHSTNQASSIPWVLSYRAACCLLPAARCLLPAACGLLAVACCPMSAFAALPC
jgi:hypothetical protein